MVEMRKQITVIPQIKLLLFFYLVITNLYCIDQFQTPWCHLIEIRLAVQNVDIFRPHVLCKRLTGLFECTVTSQVDVRVPGSLGSQIS